MNCIRHYVACWGKRIGYHVIKERRSAAAGPPQRERRTALVWMGDELLIAERAAQKGTEC